MNFMKAIFTDKLNKTDNFIETFTAIFIIAAVSVFIFVNLIAGFNLPLYIFAMAFGFALSILYPRSGVYATVFLTFIFERFFTLAPIYWNRVEYKIYPLDILMIGILIGIFFQFLSGKIKFRFKGTDFIVAAFFLLSFLYFILSISVWHGDFAISVSAFKNYAFYGLFYFIIRFLFSQKEKLFEFLKFLLGSAVVVTVFVLIGAIRGEGLWTQFTPLSTPGTRILAFTHGFFLSMALLSAIAWITFRKDSFAKFLKIIIPVWTIGIIGTLMRHLWISLAVSIVFLFTALPAKEKKKVGILFSRYILLLIVLVVFLGYIALLFPDFGISKAFLDAAGVAGKRFISTTQVSVDESLNWRKNVWKSAWDEFQKTPLFGIGYGKKLSVEIGTKYRDFVEVRNIHNSPLTIFIQMGVWGIGLVLYSVYTLMKKSLLVLRNGKMDKEDRFLLIVFLAFFINYLIAFLFQTYLETNLLGIFFWIILGGLAVLTQENEAEETKLNIANDKMQ